MNNMLSKLTGISLLFLNTLIYSNETPIIVNQKKPEKEKVELPLKYYGYIKYETFADSRQILSLAEGEFFLAPAPQLLDTNNQDINSRGQASMAVFQSRGNVEIDGPQLLGAETSGKIQVDFWSGSSTTLSRLRMRLGYADLVWPRVSLRAGQDYHPMFRGSCAPETVAFTRGVPIEAFAYNPQFRLKIKIEPFDFIANMASQRLGVSPGPNGPSTEYIRNAIIPNLNFQLHAHVQDKHIIGAGFNFKRLVPRLSTELDVKSVEINDSMAAFAFAQLDWESFFFHTKGMYVENGADLTMPGGYAVATVNAINDKRTYTNLRAAAWWADMAGDIHSFQPGLLVGYVKNLGAPKDIITSVTVNSVTESTIYTNLDSTTDYIFRLSPRVRWFIEDMTFALELEYTRAAYGTLNSKGKVAEGTDVPVNNVRLMGAIFYNF